MQEERIASPRAVVDRTNADRKIAVDVARRAAERLARAVGAQPQAHPGWTGSTERERARLTEAKAAAREEHLLFRSLTDNPFFASIDATVSSKRFGTESVRYLVSAGRGPTGSIGGQEWQLVSWTSPITQYLLDKPHGHQFTFGVQRAGVPTSTDYTLLDVAKYESLVPELRSATYSLASGKAYVGDEATLASLDNVGTTPTEQDIEPDTYQAKPTFGLGEIIVLADQDQRSGLLMPFDKTIVVEGPPGSGKTSIGIMRLACLYDQQWEARKLERGKDAPFHSYASMRALVHNPEMVPYLRELVRSIGVEGVVVQTTLDALRSVCRDARTIVGRMRTDTVELIALKGRVEILDFYLAAFRRRVDATLAPQTAGLRMALYELAPDFVALSDELTAWASRLAKASCVGSRLRGTLNLAEGLNATITGIMTGESHTRFWLDANGRVADRPRHELSTTSKERLAAGRDAAHALIEPIVRACCGHHHIVRMMLSDPAFKHVCSASPNGATTSDALRLWQEQVDAPQPTYGELDLAFSAWLASSVLLTAPDGDAPWIGTRRDKITHIMVDEAQDLTPAHVATLQALLLADGTMTLVGDLRQNLSPSGGLTAWEQAPISNARRAVFGINYRQTQELGLFLRGLHEGLYEEIPEWTWSRRLHGPKPRALTTPSWQQIIHAAQAEVRRWRDEFPRATVAVVYDAALSERDHHELVLAIETGLGDTLTQVVDVRNDARGDSLHEPDRVYVVSVGKTKGLEFDAVVYVDDREVWAQASSTIDSRTKNSLYVAVSRARAGLSLCMTSLPSSVAELAERDACELIVAVRQ